MNLASISNIFLSTAGRHLELALTVLKDLECGSDQRGKTGVPLKIVLNKILGVVGQSVPGVN